MPGEHRYQVTVEWTGNRGEGTAGYRSLRSRPRHPRRARGDHRRLVRPALPRQPVAMESRTAARGVRVAVPHAVLPAPRRDERRRRHVATSTIPTGVMTEDGAGGGAFTELTLHPVVTVADQAMVETAERLHADANRTCFIAQIPGDPRPARRDDPRGGDPVTAPRRAEPDGRVRRGRGLGLALPAGPADDVRAVAGLRRGRGGRPRGRRCVRRGRRRAPGRGSSATTRVELAVQTMRSDAPTDSTSN